MIVFGLKEEIPTREYGNLWAYFNLLRTRPNKRLVLKVRECGSLPFLPDKFLELRQLKNYTLFDNKEDIFNNRGAFCDAVLKFFGSPYRIRRLCGIQFY